jgi:hypothetical protein
LFRKVLDARVKVFGQDGFYTLRNYSTLAAVLFLQGKLNDEEASFRHLLEAQSKNLGTHPDVIVTMRTLASVLHINGKVRREVDATSSTRSKREVEGQGASTYTKYPE